MNESRSKTFRFPLQYQIGTKQSDGSCKKGAVFTGSRTATFSVGRTGVSQPFWRQIIALMGDATTPFSGNNVSLVSASPYDVYVEYNANPGSTCMSQCSGMVPLQGTFPDPNLLNSTVANNQAIRKLISDCQSRLSSFQGGPFVAEIRSTIRGLLHPAEALRRGLNSYYDDVKKHRHLRGAHLQRAMAGTWLEYQFGWRPLVKDIEGAVENLQRLSRRPRAIHFSASGIDATQQNTPMSPIDEGISQHAINIVRQIEFAVTVRLRGAYKVTAPSGWSLRDWGLGTQDFLPSVWEAIPYSFAVDYFTNIGDIISAYSYLPSNVAWVARTVRKVCTCTYQGTKLTYLDPASVRMEAVGGLGHTTITISRVDRASISAFDLIPRPTLRVPPVGSTAWLNIAGLARLKTL